MLEVNFNYSQDWWLGWVRGAWMAEVGVAETSVDAVAVAVAEGQIVRVIVLFIIIY